MRIVIFGASGMVGQGALSAALADPDVERVVAVVRAPIAVTDPKLEQVTHTDYTDYTPLTEVLTGVDGTLFCLGTTSAGKSEAEYAVIARDYPVAAAKAVARYSPDSAFILVTGAGADSSTTGRVMWARVRGQAENEILELPLHGHMFRPGYIQPQEGVQSKTPLYKAFYRVGKALYPVLKRVTPGHVTTSEVLGRAMLATVRDPAAPAVVEVSDINRLGA